jgi:hypothetical protein
VRAIGRHGALSVDAGDAREPGDRLAGIVDELQLPPGTVGDLREVPSGGRVIRRFRYENDRNLHARPGIGSSV